MTAEDGVKARSLIDFAPFAETYDRWYATSTGMKHDLAQKADVLRFLPRAQPGERLLDVGCGTGHWSRCFAMLGYAVVAVDVSPEMVHVAYGSRPTGTAFNVADAAALPFKDAAFDIAAAMATLEFLPAPERALEEMARCVRSSGRILIGVLNRTAALNRERLATGREPYASGHLYSPDELRSLLELFGAIRMAASDPDGSGFMETPSELSSTLNETGLNGPFIVAEVQK